MKIKFSLIFILLIYSCNNNQYVDFKYKAFELSNGTKKLIDLYLNVVDIRNTNKSLLIQEEYKHSDKYFITYEDLQIVSGNYSSEKGVYVGKYKGFRIWLIGNDVKAFMINSKTVIEKILLSSVTKINEYDIPINEEDTPTWFFDFSLNHISNVSFIGCKLSQNRIELIKSINWE